MVIGPTLDRRRWTLRLGLAFDPFDPHALGE
jgi:hypothetical protein